jgi:transaldolase
MMAENVLMQLLAQGQSIWLDNITRDLLQNGTLGKMIHDGLRGMTSNPTIFQKAIASGSAYDAQITELNAQHKSPEAVFEGLAVTDIQEACDQFRALYDSSNALDGYVSIEVAPTLAHDTQGTLVEARRLWKAVSRPNVMIKVPGTAEGALAVKELLAEGINVNVTLLFSLQNHERVMWAYIEALEQRAASGAPIDRIASVASFFVSRVDTLVDKLLEGKIAAAGSDAEKAHLKSLMGKAAIANARLAYQRFREIFDSERFTKLKTQGAHVQRPLWASTSTKNPAYRDVIYIEQLIGPDTVNTVPDATITAVEDHGQVARTIDLHLDEAKSALAELQSLGIDYNAITKQLEDEGVQKFAESYAELIEGVRGKVAQIG